MHPAARLCALLSLPLLWLSPSVRANPDQLRDAGVPQRGLVRLHVQADGPNLQLFRDDLGPVPLCVAPCDTLVDGRDGEQFFFGGEDYVSTESFRLLARTGDLRMHVHAGSKNGRTLGFIGAGLGYLAASLGVGLLGLSVAPNDSLHPSEGFHLTDDQRRSLRIGGGISLGAGLILLGTGFWQILNSRSTYAVAP